MKKSFPVNGTKKVNTVQFISGNSASTLRQIRSNNRKSDRYLPGNYISNILLPMCSCGRHVTPEPYFTTANDGLNWPSKTSTQTLFAYNVKTC